LNEYLESYAATPYLPDASHSLEKSKLDFLFDANASKPKVTVPSPD